MKDLNRLGVARHLHNIANAHQEFPSRKLMGDDWLEKRWLYLVEHGWHQGYLALADEVVSKGYKP